MVIFWSIFMVKHFDSWFGFVIRICDSWFGFVIMGGAGGYGDYEWRLCLFAGCAYCVLIAWLLQHCLGEFEGI